MSVHLIPAQQPKKAVAPPRINTASDKKNILFIFEGNGGNSAFILGVLEYIASLKNINPVGFVGTSGGAKTAGAAAVGFMQNGLAGMFSTAELYWSLVAEQGNKCSPLANPVFAMAHIFMNAHGPTLAANLSAIDNHVIKPADLIKLARTGVYLGMNVVCNSTHKGIYISGENVTHDALMATAALRPSFPLVYLPKIIHPVTQEVIFSGGPCRDGGQGGQGLDGTQGGEVLIGKQAIDDFELLHPEMKGDYDVVVVSLSTSGEEELHRLKEYDPRIQMNMRVVESLRRAMSERDSNLHVIHADLPYHFRYRPMDGHPMTITTGKLLELKELGVRIAREQLSRSLSMTHGPQLNGRLFERHR